ncbi:terminase large subunit domain-containing protein [Streptomyces noursei]|uniref:terminase large subunit domain-containing protein n=1 Tax=Streptomyces noursei TaxID=1971 RepID=UPI0019645A0C|nr:terminase family protein [Streptomyces noursei]QRX90842.1 terminase family protein [Streptomyces noursei]
MLDSLPLSRKQLQSIAQATARICLWHGAVRSGKTVASLLAFVLAVAEAPASGLIVISGRSLQTIERNCLEPLQDEALFGPVARQVRHTRGATTAVILGRTVHLIGAADARAEGRLRGLTACLAYVDEATLLPEAFFVQLLARLSVPQAKVLCTTNPDGPRHWLKTGYLDREAELDLKSWHFRLDDNPSLPRAYVASLAAEYVGLWKRRMIDGAWCVAEGAVYDMWDEQQHVVDSLPAMRRLWLGIDYGTSNIPSQQPITERPRPVRHHRHGALIPNPATKGEDPCTRLSTMRAWTVRSWRYPPARSRRRPGRRCPGPRNTGPRSPRRSRASSWASTTGASSIGSPVGTPRPSRLSRPW